MPYVSCRYGPSPDPVLVDAPQTIICTDDQGVEWHLTEDSQVGDWLRFKEEDGEVLAYDAAPEPEVDEPRPEQETPNQELPAD